MAKIWILQRFLTGMTSWWRWRGPINFSCIHQKILTHLLPAWAWMPLSLPPILTQSLMLHWIWNRYSHNMFFLHFPVISHFYCCMITWFCIELFLDYQINIKVVAEVIVRWLQVAISPMTWLNAGLTSQFGKSWPKSVNMESSQVMATLNFTIWTTFFFEHNTAQYHNLAFQ